MTASVNGVRLSYSDIGHGMPLICLHGGMGVDAASLRVPGILDLARLGIRLIIPDQRGHGDSERTKASDYSHGVWAADVHDLAERLGLSAFALFGHSWEIYGDPTPDPADTETTVVSLLTFESDANLLSASIAPNNRRTTSRR